MTTSKSVAAGSLLLSAGLLIWANGAVARQPRIYWGDDVPKGWNGDWPPELRTIPERTGYLRTMSTQQLHEWIAALKARSDNVYSVVLFTSPLKKVAPAMVLANPRVGSPRQARASGKPVVFLLGNIHPPEPEAAGALLLVARDLAAGRHKAILDKVIVMIAPIFNVDGTDNVVPQDGSLGSQTPEMLGVRENSQRLDLNRDGVRGWCLNTAPVSTPRRTARSLHSVEGRAAPDLSDGGCRHTWPDHVATSGSTGSVSIVRAGRSLLATRAAPDTVQLR